MAVRTKPVRILDQNLLMNESEEGMKKRWLSGLGAILVIGTHGFCFSPHQRAGSSAAMPRPPPLGTTLSPPQQCRDRLVEREEANSLATFEENGSSSSSSAGRDGDSSSRHISHQSSDTRYGVANSELLKGVRVSAFRGDAKGVAAAMKALESQGLPADLHLYNQLLWAFKVAGDISGGEKAFAELQRVQLRPNCITFTTMLGLYGQAGRVQDAEQVFVQMTKRGIRPNKKAYLALMRAYVSARDSDGAEDVMFRLASQGIKPDREAYTVLLKAYLSKHDMRGAEDVIRRVEMSPGLGVGTEMLNALIRAYSRRGGPHDVARTLRRAEAQGAQEAEAVGRVLADLEKTRGAISGQKGGSVMAVEGPELVSSPMAMRATWGVRAQAAERELTRRAEEGEEVREEDWCAVMTLWSQAGDGDAARRVMETHGVTVTGLNILMHFFGRRGLVEETEQLLERMINHGLAPNTVTFNTVLHGYVKKGGNQNRRLGIEDLHRTMEVYDEVMSLASRGLLRPDAHTFSSILRCLQTWRHEAPSNPFYRVMADIRLYLPLHERSSPIYSTALHLCGLVYDPDAALRLVQEARELAREEGAIITPADLEFIEGKYKAARRLMGFPQRRSPLKAGGQRRQP